MRTGIKENLFPQVAEQIQIIDAFLTYVEKHFSS